MIVERLPRTDYLGIPGVLGNQFIKERQVIGVGMVAVESCKGHQCPHREEIAVNVMHE